MAYLKDSTLSSQMSEYDNVPRSHNYYGRNPENTRRAFDPTFEIRYNGDFPRRNPTYPKCEGKRGLVSEPSLLNELKSKPYNCTMEIPVVTTRSSQTITQPFPTLVTKHSKEDKISEKSCQMSSSSLRPQTEREGITPKVRSLQSSTLTQTSQPSREMARVPSFFFYLLVFIAEILLFGVLILSLVWVQLYQGGFAWREDVKREFNLHPVLMITGFIFLMGHAMLTYRLFGCCSKLGAKLLHTILYLMAIPCIVVSTIAVFDSHDLRTPPIPNLYSLHSWMGVITIGLFALQLVVGFFSFWMLLLCEQGTSSFRASLVPVHSSFGLITFMLAIATCVTGFTEKAFFTLKNEAGDTIYQDLPIEAFIINAMGTALVALAILVPTLVGLGYFRSSKYLDEMSAL